MAKALVLGKKSPQNTTCTLHAMVVARDAVSQKNGHLFSHAHLAEDVFSCTDGKRLSELHGLSVRQSTSTKSPDTQRPDTLRGRRHSAIQNTLAHTLWHITQDSPGARGQSVQALPFNLAHINVKGWPSERPLTFSTLLSKVCSGYFGQVRSCTLFIVQQNGQYTHQACRQGSLSQQHPAWHAAQQCFLLV
jgi:hypothetical protein